MANDQETVIIDFEYSCVNYRGADLASYINEAAIDYSISELPNFKINYDLFVNFEDPDSWVHKAIAIYLGEEKDQIASLTQEVKGLLL